MPGGDVRFKVNFVVAMMHYFLAEFGHVSMRDFVAVAILYFFGTVGPVI